MAQLKLTIVGNSEPAKQEIKKLENQLNNVGKKPIEIKVTSSGLDAAISKLKETTKQETEAASANERLIQSYVEAAKRAAVAAQQSLQLYNAYKQIAQSAESASKGQLSLSDSTDLVAKNVGLAESRVKGLTAAYNELAQTLRGINGGGGGSDGGGGQRALPAPGEIAIRNNGNENNWNYNRQLLDFAIDVDWKSVAEEAGNAALSMNSLSDSAGNAWQSFNSLGESARTAWQRLSEGTPIADALGDSISNIVVKITTWQVVNGIVASIKRAFKDALETMKEVDSELVTVRKVTGFTVDEMKRVEEQAYKTASAYGVAADEYLKGVSAFARAGYKEQSADLAELATKTQIVGDTTADVANQFLLSVDAAYKYNGSIQELSRVLDGANEIDNKYATSIEKIAEGMGIVAPVAAQMHVSIDELAAAIGTITAVTQRSGNEAARALRALFLNIAGDTKTEIDEGVTWTTGEIEGLRDVIKLYAKDAYDAAQATKTIIDPMRAMEGLAKSMESGLLSEQKLIEMVSDIGGKLRTSQLLAIIQNWDMYQSMLVDYGNAIGSADKEVSNALNSWERKTAQLNNAFTEFISHIVDTNGIKAGIDILTGFIKVLDSGVGKVAALSAAFLAMGRIIAQIGKSNTFNFLLNEIIGLTSGTVTATTALADMWALLSTNPVVWAVAAAAAVYGIVKAYDALNVTAEEYAERIRNSVDAYKDAEDEIKSLSEKIEANNDLIEQSNQLGGNENYENRLRRENEKLQEQLAILQQRQKIEVREAADSAVGIAGSTFTAGQRTFDLETYLSFLEKQSEGDAVSVEKTRALFDSLIDSVLSARDALNLYHDVYGYLTPEQEKSLELFDRIIASYVAQINNGSNVVATTSDIADAFSEAAEAADNETTALEKLRTALDDAADSLSVVKTAFKDFNDDGKISYSTISQIIDKFSDLNEDSLAGYIERLTDVKLTSDDLQSILGEMTLELVEQKIETENLTQKDQALVEKMLEEAGVANAAEVAASLLKDKTDDLAESTSEATGEIQNFNNTPVNTTAQQNAVSGLSGKFDQLATSIHDAREQLAAYKNESGDGSQWKHVDKKGAFNKNQKADEKQNGNFTWVRPTKSASDAIVSPVFEFDFGGDDGGTTRTAKETDPELEAIKLQIEAHKDKVALLKSELSLMKERGDSEEDIVAKMREIQAAEHDSAEYMRENQDRWAELKIDQTDVNALSLDWWKIQKDINDLLEETVELREDELDLIQSSIALEKQQLDFLEESGKSTEEQIDQIKVIQAKLHEEAELRRQNLQILKDSGASASEIADAESDILKLSTEWWNYQNQIAKLLEKEAQESEKKRTELIKQAKEEALALLEAQEEAEKGPLQKQLELLEGQKDALSAEREEAEKLLAVEKAREALANAQNERTVRQYNARTGQWEWVANASNVAKAQENLANAEQNLSDYYAKREIDDLKARIAEVGNTYDQLRDAVNDFAEAVQNGTASWDEAQDFLLAAIGDFGGAVVQSAVNAANAFNAIVDGVTGNPDQAGSGGQSSGSGSGMTAKKLKNLNDVTLGDGTTVTDLAALAFSGGNAVEAYRDENGVGDYYLTHARTRAYSSYNGEDTLAYLAAGVKAGQITKQQAANLLSELMLDTTLMDNRVKMATLGKGYTLFNDGSSLLRLSENTSGLNSTASNYAAYLRSMGIVTSSGESYAGFGGVTNNRIGTQNNGDTYQFGNISLSEQQARSMTVYDLANMAGELSLHNPAV